MVATVSAIKTTAILFLLGKNRCFRFSTIRQNLDVAATRAFFMHQAFVDFRIHRILYPYSIQPAFDSVHHAAPIFVYKAYLLHTLVGEAFFTFPLPAQKVS